MPETLMFDKFPFLLLAAPFLGLLCSGLVKRHDPEIRGDRVLRHDAPARIAHWTHGIGTAALIVSGVVLGTRLTASFVAAGEPAAFWFDAHYVFAAIFLFGTFFWMGNTLVSPHRFREHLPTKKCVSSTINHYGSLLGFKKCTYPREEKYFESERIAFLMALGGGALMAITGIVKVLAHVVSMPEQVMTVATWAHDIGAAIMLLFLLAHVFFGALIPVAWKTVPSMIFGSVSLEHARHEHAAWIEELEAKGASTDAASSTSPADTMERGLK